MKFLKILFITFSISLPLLLFIGCSDADVADNREREYGYVQFKLFKEVSYEKTNGETRAIKNQLDYLNEANKIMVTLQYEEGNITQTLVLNSADKESAEFGLRSDKLGLTSGTYQLVTFTLYDANDQELYRGAPDTDNRFEIVAGGLTVQEVTVKVEPRGAVKFRFTKDLSGFTNMPQARASTKQYAFHDIGKIDVTVINTQSKEQTIFTGLPVTLSEFVSESDNGAMGNQTSVLICDTTLSLKSGDYEIFSYATYDNTKPIKNARLLETNLTPAKSPFSVVDNKTTETDVAITLYESDEYIKDYYALYEIWLALDGPNWSYKGKNYPVGTNWDFNRSPDLWGAQPGVAIHSNGRIGSINLSGFNFKGHMPAALGQLTELIDLYLGTHADAGLSPIDPALQPGNSLIPVEIDDLTRMERAKQLSYMKYSQRMRPKFLDLTVNKEIKEEMVAKISSKSVSLKNYMKYVGDAVLEPELFDVHHGKLYNGLKSLPEEIGNLKKLTGLWIANGEIETLPEAMASLTACTDLEIYNCPKMKEFPMSITQMPELISVNISNNKQIPHDELHRGLDALASGPSNEKIQIIYCVENSLEEIPESFSNLKKLGLLDFSYNKINRIHPLGADVRPVQFFLDYNELTSIPRNSEGVYCGMEDIEEFSVTNNRLTEFPNIFTSKINLTIGTVDFSFNKISRFEGQDDGSFNGVNMDILRLNNNPLGIFPTCLAETNSYLNGLEMDGCEITEVPEGSFLNETEYNSYFSSLSTIILSNNRIKELPKEFDARRFPFLYGLSLSGNAFSKFPYHAVNIPSLAIVMIANQRDDAGKRTLSEWPSGIWQHTGLRQLDISSNNLGKVAERLSPNIILLVYDNPNLTMDISSICPYLMTGYKLIYYDDNQDMRGCDDYFND